MSTLTGDSATSSASGPSSAPAQPDAERSGLLQTLLHRRVPHIGAIYLGGTWSIVEVVGWATDRFVLSPYLQEVVFLALVLMVPAVLLLAYGHGAPGKDRWSRFELIGVAANLLVTAGLLVGLYGGKDLGSAQQTVRLAGLSGETTERAVPKADFRKRIGLFYFDGADSLAALRRALPYAMEADLMQDLFVATHTPAALAEPLRTSGHADALDVPLALRRDIAREYSLAYLADGRIERTGDGYRLTTTLRTTDDLGVVAEHAFAGSDLMPLIDQATAQLRRDLEIPSAHLEQTPDLPVEEITTASVAALGHFGVGYDALFVQSNPGASADAFEAAVAEDPTFAYAHFFSMYLYSIMGQPQKVAAARAAAEQHKYRLTEPFRYALRVNQLIMAHKMEAAQELAEQWTTLYPNDKSAWSVRAEVESLRDMPAASAASLQRVIDLNPGQAQLRLKVARLLSNAQQHDAALEEVTAYTEQFPDRADGYTQLGAVHMAAGAPEEALQAYRQALLHDPNSATVLRTLGKAHLRLGQYGEAETQLRAAYAKGQAPEERGQALLGIADYYWTRGQYASFRTYVDSMLTQAAQHQSAYVVRLGQAAIARRLHQAGDVDRAKTYATAAEDIVAQVGRQSADVGVFHILLARYYIETGALDTAAQHLDQAQDVVTAFGMTKLLRTYSYHYARGRLLEARAQWEEAEAAYQKDVEIDGADTGSRYRLAEIARQQGRLDDAERYYREVLKRHPSHPNANASYARLLHDDGRLDAARVHLDRALEAWQNADPDFAPAAEARALDAELKARA